MLLVNDRFSIFRRSPQAPRLLTASLPQQPVFSTGKIPHSIAYRRLRRQQASARVIPPRAIKPMAPGSGTVVNWTFSTGAPAEPLSCEPNRRTVRGLVSDSLISTQPKLFAELAYHDCTSLSRLAPEKL